MLHLAVEFDHRVFRECLRTSAAPGSGEAIAPRLARAGATIAVADLDAAGARRFAAVVHFLASPDCSFVTAQCYDASGGRATY